MTTEKLQLARDMTLENDIYVIKNAKCLLSGAAYTWNNWEQKIDTTEKSIGMLGQRLQVAFPSFSHWLFLGHRNWQPNNRIVKYKKLWSALSAKGINIPDGERINEIMVSSENGVKYFGLIKCGSIVSNSIAAILRSGLETQLLFAEQFDAMKISEYLLLEGWEHVGNALSDKVIDLLCEKDIFAYLPLGWFDDRESGCAVIAKERLIDLSFSEYTSLR